MRSAASAPASRHADIEDARAPVGAAADAAAHRPRHLLSGRAQPRHHRRQPLPRRSGRRLGQRPGGPWRRLHSSATGAPARAPAGAGFMTAAFEVASSRARLLEAVRVPRLLPARAEASTRSAARPASSRMRSAPCCGTPSAPSSAPSSARPTSRSWSRSARRCSAAGAVTRALRFERRANRLLDHTGVTRCRRAHLHLIAPAPRRRLRHSSHDADPAHREWAAGERGRRAATHLADFLREKFSCSPPRICAASRASAAPAPFSSTGSRRAPASPMRSLARAPR